MSNARGNLHVCCETGTLQDISHTLFIVSTLVIVTNGINTCEDLMTSLAATTVLIVIVCLFIVKLGEDTSMCGELEARSANMTERSHFLDKTDFGDPAWDKRPQDDVRASNRAEKNESKLKSSASVQTTPDSLSVRVQTEELVFNLHSHTTEQHSICTQTNRYGCPIQKEEEDDEEEEEEEGKAGTVRNDSYKETMTSVDLETPQKLQQKSSNQLFDDPKTVQNPESTNENSKTNSATSKNDSTDSINSNENANKFTVRTSSSSNENACNFTLKTDPVALFNSNTYSGQFPSSFRRLRFSRCRPYNVTQDTLLDALQQTHLTLKRPDHDGTNWCQAHLNPRERSRKTSKNDLEKYMNCKDDELEMVINSNARVNVKHHVYVLDPQHPQPDDSAQKDKDEPNKRKDNDKRDKNEKKKEKEGGDKEKLNEGKRRTGEENRDKACKEKFGVVSKMPVMEESLTEEKARLATFVNHETLPGRLWVTKIAAAGFYCLETNHNVVRCAFCNIEENIRKFLHDDPIRVHKTLSPTCPLLLNTASNVTMEQFNNTASAQYQDQFHRFYGEFNGRAEEMAPENREREMSQLGVSSANPGSASNTGASAGAFHQPFPTSLNPSSSSASHGVYTTAPTAANNTASHTPSANNTASYQSADVSISNNITEALSAQSGLSNNTMSTTSATVEATAGSSRAEASTLVPNSSGLSPPTLPPNSSQASGTSASSSSADIPRQTVTYGQLGIYTEEPKRPDFAIVDSRLGTYTGWPHNQTHTPEEMAEAGFYYVGQEDLVRCFYCKGGLKSWANHLRPWVEHARFYPKCPFVGQVKGQDYIDVVQELKAQQEMISAAEVDEELRRRLSERQSSAVTSADVHDDVTRSAEELESENQSLVYSRTCKICQEKEVSILFLPCGHLVACAQCAPALRTCAVCRQKVKGRVKVID